MWWSSKRNALAKRRKDLDSCEADKLTKILNVYDELLQNPPKEDMSLEAYLLERKWEADMIEAVDVLVCQSWCTDVKHLSCQALKMDLLGSQEGESRLDAGYASLFEKYSSRLNILLKEEVSQVNWVGCGVAGGSVVVTTNRNHFTAKKVIITLPVGVLKSNDVQFYPPLPPEKLEALDSMVMSPAIKIIFKFTRFFWNPEMVYLCHVGSAPR
eukprot:TRINITY_DN4573_c0_g1_i22.p1 TRINITY_DN4573_c0_g1~~TRINITY_DN4573_c0_g1_i22.p1  ORF type:complete len:213 (+),score=42.68 TRINITY_DN4573_c0_g1_i22:516-1154(+)